jgi:hypothetical protein
MGYGISIRKLTISIDTVILDIDMGHLVTVGCGYGWPAAGHG